MLRAARALTLKRVVGASVLDNTRQSFRVRRKKIFWDNAQKRERVLKIYNNARIYNRYFSSSIISIVVIVSC